MAGFTHPDAHFHDRCHLRGIDHRGQWEELGEQDAKAVAGKAVEPVGVGVGDDQPGGQEDSTVRIASQVSVWAPPLAIDPSVSMTTVAATSRRTASSRPSSRRRLDRSAAQRSLPASSTGTACRGRADVMSFPLERDEPHHDKRT